MGLRAKQAFEAEALARRLDLRARARADAAAGHAGAEAFAAAARDVSALLAAERARLESQRQTLAAEAERALRGAGASPPDIAGAIAQARLDLRQAEGRLVHDYAAARARARDAEADLDAFKRAHGLRRSAHYPDSRVLQAGLLLAAAVFESLFSAALFAETDSRGLLGGAVTAIGLSGANVTLGFLGGFLGLRYLQHARTPLKAAGALAFALLTGLAVFLNLFAALWRQRLSSGAAPLDLDDSNAFARIAAFLADAFSLHEPQAIVLLMLGGGVWVFSALKGYSGFDDPYPDYGKLARAARDAAEDLSDRRSDARDDLEAPIDAAKRQIQSHLEDARKALASMERTYEEAAGRLRALDRDMRNLDEAARGALALYVRERAAAGAPMAALDDSRSEPAPDPLAAAGAILARAREDLAQARRDSAAGLDALLGELEAAQARLDRPAPP